MLRSTSIDFAKNQLSPSLIGLSNLDLSSNVHGFSHGLDYTFNLPPILGTRRRHGGGPYIEGLWRKRQGLQFAYTLRCILIILITGSGITTKHPSHFGCIKNAHFAPVGRLRAGAQAPGGSSCLHRAFGCRPPTSLKYTRRRTVHLWAWDVPVDVLHTPSVARPCPLARFGGSCTLPTRRVRAPVGFLSRTPFSEYTGARRPSGPFPECTEVTYRLRRGAPWRLRASAQAPYGGELFERFLRRLRLPLWFIS